MKELSIFRIFGFITSFFLLLFLLSYRLKTSVEILNPKSKIWAVLVAGSRGWENYRHQADVCQAYQTLVGNGIPESNIITFMYDDIAFNKNNVIPGLIKNHPNGSNVYSGVKKDFTGDMIRVQILEKVLLGEGEGRGEEGGKGGREGGGEGEGTGARGIETGRVLNSSPGDSVIIYFAGHGGPGFLNFPDSEYLSAVKFRDILKKMKIMGRFQRMLIYIEACNSGSMFEGEEDFFYRHGILGITASNATGSSFGCCFDQQLGSFLGDAFSVSLFTSNRVLNTETSSVLQQVQYVKESVNKSSVSMYGAKHLEEDKLFRFLGRNQGFIENTENILNPTDITDVRFIPTL